MSDEKSEQCNYTIRCRSQEQYAQLRRLLAHEWAEYQADKKRGANRADVLIDLLQRSQETANSSGC